MWRMIIDIYKLGIGSLYRQKSKQCFHDSLLDNYNLSYLQICNAVIVSILANTTGENFKYRH
jgi:hypothetical protein